MSTLEKSMKTNLWDDIPWKHSRVRIALLRLVFRRRWFVQIGSSVYILRDPVE